MKPLFKLCIPKILFFLLVANTEIRTAEITVAAIASEELAGLVVMGAAAIHEMLVRYGQGDKSEDEILLIDVLETSIPIQRILVTGKSDEDVVTEVTQAVTTVIGMEHNLSTGDQNKLDHQLRLQKLMFTNTIADNRSWGRAEYRFSSHRATIDQIKSSNREKGRILGNQEVDKFVLANVIAHHPSNQAETQKNFEKILRVFIDCNSPSYARRIEARMLLSEIAKCNPYVFGHDIKEAVLNLQARYFDKDRLIDISYDMRLPETMKMFLRESPFFWNNERKLKELYDYVEKFNLDPENSFDLMRQRDSGELTGEAKKRSYEKCKLQTIWFKGKIFPYPNRYKEILNEPDNRELGRVAALCERGQFEEALSIANRFKSRSTIKSPMMNVIDHYRQKLCNKVGILKKYEYLPTWKQLLPSEKRVVALNVALQNQMNRRLQGEAIALSEAELKVVGELVPEDPISLAPDSNSPSTEQPISDIAPPPLPPDQDPDRDEEQEQDREQVKKKDSRPIPPKGRKRIKKSQEGHNWREEEGHLVKTPENEQLVENMANDSECYLGPPDRHGNHWYGKILKDGKQVWAKIRDDEIVAWGINKPDNIKKWNPETGLAALKIPRKPL